MKDMQIRGFSDQLYQHSNFSAFLRGYYERNRGTTKWSYSIWAKKLGMKKANLVRMVRGTRPIGPEAEAAFCRYFGFKGEERKYAGLICMQSNLQRTYPEYSLRIPQIDLVQKRLRRTKSPAPEDPAAIPFMAMPEAQWLLTALQGNTRRFTKEQLLSCFQKGIENESLGRYLQEAERLKLVRQANGVLSFDSDATIYSDSKIASLEVAIQRHRKVLGIVKNIFESNAAEGSFDSICVPACCFKMKGEDFQLLLDKLRNFLFGTLMSEFENLEGDVVLDLQTFVHLVADLRTIQSGPDVKRKARA